MGIQAKNELENYCFQMKNQLEEEKFTEEDKKTIEDGCKDTLQWLEANQSAESTEYEAKKKELEGKFNPIMMKVYQAAGGAPGAGGMPDMGGMGGGMGGAPPNTGAGADVNDLD